MVTEFSFDTDFFDSKALNTVGLSITHDSILQMWRDHGVLILPPGKLDAFRGLVKKLPVKYHQRWMHALETYRKIILEDEWSNFSEYENFEAVTKLCGFFKTGLAEDDIGKIISGSDDAAVFCSKTGFELLGAGAASESVNFRSSRDAGAAAIAHGMCAQDIWSEKIAPLAKYSKNITIIDRYLFTRIRDALGRGSIDSGALGFIKMLSNIDKKFCVKIISGGDIKGSDAYHEVINYFVKHVVSSAPLSKVLDSLALVSNHDDFFRDYAHERFVRFDNHVCEIGVGMQVFEGYPSPMTNFSLRHISDTVFPNRESISSKNILWREYLV